MRLPSDLFSVARGATRDHSATSAPGLFFEPVHLHLGKRVASYSKACV